MLWCVKALGNASGYVNGAGPLVTQKKSIHVDNYPLILESEDGKLGDSEDSFLYYYCTICAAEDNFRLKVTLHVEVPSGIVRNQCGYGLMLTDTDAADSPWARHRNQLFLGHIGKEPKALVRLVAGYTDPSAEEGYGRILDQSRYFNGKEKWPDKSCTDYFEIEKTNEGFSVRYGLEHMFIPGCDFLMKQNTETICVGVALARGIRLYVEDFSFMAYPGKASETPVGTIRSCLPVYPFPESLLHVYTERTALMNGEVYVSPAGQLDGRGSREDPMDLLQATLSVAPGAIIHLLDGIYDLHVPLIIPKQCSGTALAPITLKAENRRKAILSGRSLREQPLMVLGSDFWQLEGLTFQESKTSGLVICGSCNKIIDCEARDNGDTGILIVAPTGIEKDDWPAYNQVCGCDSHDNCDPTKESADGFGAKLRIGRGNEFFNCMAYHNADDGFDLYSKSVFGPTAPVEIDSCVAFQNGFFEKEGKRARGSGVGFKLGGENQMVAHEVWNCLAIQNANGGFSSNTNPDCRLHFCTAIENGTSKKSNFRMYSKLRKKEDYVLEGILSMCSLPVSPNALLPFRMENGALTWNIASAIKKRSNKHTGADPLRKKNVMFLISSLGGGGAERVTVCLANEFSRRHHVVLAYDADKETTYPIEDNVSLYKLSADIGKRPRSKLGRCFCRMWTLYKSRCAIRKIQKEHDIEIVISMLEGPNLKNAISGGNVKHIMSERNDPTCKPPKYYMKEKFCFARSDYVVFQTGKVRKMFSKRVQQKSCIIPNPTEVSVLAAPTRSKKIVSAGRLHSQKNQKLLLKAFSLFHEKHEQYQLFLYGDGELRDELIAYSNELCLGDAVVFEHFRSDIHAAIADAELFVLSSDYEGMSNALMEAMMMGIACISTACTGSTDLIEDGINGLLVPIGDDHALANAMERLAENEALRKKLERNAMLSAEAYSVDRVSRRWERLML